MSKVPTLRLRPKHDRRIKSGHPWVFSNEIADDLRGVEPGSTVDVADATGRFLGRGYVNPHSLIAVRLLTRDRGENIDLPGFFAHRIRLAVACRAAVYPDRRSCRLVHAEGDGLPGLVVDRLGDTLAVQITTLGMEVRREALQLALEEVLSPGGAVLRNDTRVRELEGLAQGREPWFGDVPPEVEIEEDGVRFGVEPLAGQKTGHFFDQYENRRFAAALCAGRTVLDVYANAGAWALHALARGAVSATTVDKSEECCVRTEANAARNGVSDRLTIVCDEGKRTLEALVGGGHRFGAVVLDPPAFARSRKVASAALRGYRDVNALGLALVEPGGFLFTSSCSYHVEEDRFLDEIRKAAVDAGRSIRIVRRGEQAADHPVDPAVPESRYLKSFALFVTT